MTDQRSPAWRLFILILGAVAILSLVAAACTSGDDDDGGNGDDPTATTDAGNSGDNDDNGDDADGDGDGDGDSDSLAQLAAFGDDYDSFSGQVSYTITDFGGGDNAGLSDISTMTIYQKGSSSRFDISSADGDISFISTPDASYLCSSGTSGGDCLQYPADDVNAGASVASFATLFSASSINEGIDDIPNGVNVVTSNEEIAGVDATCFTATGDLDPSQAGDESSQFCFSDGGLMLRLQFESAGETVSFEATSASEDVPDSAFEPPFPVTDLSDLGDLGDLGDILP